MLVTEDPVRVDWAQINIVFRWQLAVSTRHFS